MRNLRFECAGATGLTRGPSGRAHTHTPGKTIGGPTHLQSHFLLNDGSTKNVRKSYFPIGFEAQSPHITFRDFDRCSTFLHDFL